MNSRSLGMKLRTYRAKHRWSVGECAERIGITSRYLVDIERGDKVPKLETFLSILNALEASADDVLQDSLRIGCREKSNDLLKKISALPAPCRKQALEIFEAVVTILFNTQ